MTQQAEQALYHPNQINQFPGKLLEMIQWNEQIQNWINTPHSRHRVTSSGETFNTKITPIYPKWLTISKVLVLQNYILCTNLQSAVLENVQFKFYPSKCDGFISKLIQSLNRTTFNKFLRLYNYIYITYIYVLQSMLNFKFTSISSENTLIYNYLRSQFQLLKTVPLPLWVMHENRGWDHRV